MVVKVYEHKVDVLNKHLRQVTGHPAQYAVEEFDRLYRDFTDKGDPFAFRKSMLRLRVNIHHREAMQNFFENIDDLCE